MPGCPSCGTQNLGDNKFCCQCGFKLENNTGELPVGTVLEGRYTILNSLGRGGMGAVYLAQDSRLNNSPVALKEMSVKALAEEELEGAIDSFKREATMLVKLRNPALPRVIDFFSVGERHWYLAMDFIEGETLKAIVERRGAIPESEVRDWAIQLCKILDYLHSQEPPIIFRDLKPANIMLTEEGVIKLIDFGIARHFKAGITQDTTAYGSTGFAPPEQYGQNQTDARSDVYALGATLHYLLTGIEPGANPFTFDKPSEHVELTKEMEEIVMKALELKPENRPSSMQEFLDLLQAQVKTETTDETTIISETRSQELGLTTMLDNEAKNYGDDQGKNKKLYTALGAVAAVLILFSVIGLILLIDSEDENNKDKVATEEIETEPLKEEKDDSGDGTLILPGGAKYTGEIIDGKANGQGIARWTNGDKYVGEFMDNKMHGYGTYTWANGDKVVGEFRDGKYIETAPETDTSLPPHYRAPKSTDKTAAEITPEDYLYEVENIQTVVFSHYGSIPDNLEYAYSLFSTRWKSKVSWEKWKKGFSKTLSDTVHYVVVAEVSSNKAVAEFAMTSRDSASDGRVLVKDWLGSWKLIKEYGEWKLDEPKIENTAEYYE